MGMGVSLESRVPFLDHKFVEFSMSIPTRLKTKDGNLKSILKKAVRGTIPDELIDRRKQGFSVPLHDWFRQELGTRMKDEVRNFCRETDYLDWPACERLFDTNQSLQTWFLFNLALWWRHSFR
jgi:asparagine synthase (glutamine-hydrolysing)